MVEQKLSESALTAAKHLSCSSATHTIILLDNIKGNIDQTQKLMRTHLPIGYHMDYYGVSATGKKLISRIQDRFRKYVVKECPTYLQTHSGSKR